jgi:hypothetical protein
VCGDHRRAFVSPPNLPWPGNELPYSTTFWNGDGKSDGSKPEHSDGDGVEVSAFAEAEAAIENWLASLQALAAATAALNGSLAGHTNQCTQVTDPTPQTWSTHFQSCSLEKNSLTLPLPSLLVIRLTQKVSSLFMARAHAWDRP